MKKRYLGLAALMLANTLFASIDYMALHDVVIRFYGYQRAGLKTGTSGNLNGMNVHKGDEYNGNPLDGGWYDAGDYIKFGMPLGYTVYCLLKGYDIFPSAYADKYKQDNSSGADGIPDVLNQVKYATDYLMKAVIDENTVVLDVGIAADEHKGLDDPIPFSTGRSKKQIILCSGADVPATYAACLALMSTVYRTFDATYADACLKKAVVAFKFAKKKISGNQLYCQPQKKAGKALYDYYTPPDGKVQRQIGDRMAAAGVELYRASNDADPEYKAWAGRSITAMYNCMSFSFIGPLASFEVWRQGLGGASSVFDNVGFVNNLVHDSGPFKGVYQNSGWGTARDVGTAAMVYALGYVTISSESQRADYKAKVLKHINWVTGTNPKSQSYIVGVGNGPKSIHYRPPKNPVGGLVSGPDGAGAWEDNRNSPAYTEVACDYNAGIVGAIAFIIALDRPGTAIQLTSAFSASPEDNLDLTAKPVIFKAGFSAPVKWTLTITGGSGTKTYTGTGTSMSQTWDGSADQGLFLSGESVAASLKIDKNLVAYDILNAKAIKIFIEKAKKIAANPGDKVVDDFDDGNVANMVGGNWVPYGNQTSFSGKTTARAEVKDGQKVLNIKCNITGDGIDTYAGAKSTFNAAGSAVSIGDVKTITFDLSANKPTRVSVELEQANITDGAYYGMTVPVTTYSNTYRLAIAQFKQPDWKTAEKPLDLKAISGVRFTIYDSTGMITMSLDNVTMEGLSTAAITNAYTPATAHFNPSIRGATIQYIMPQTLQGALECRVFDIAGKVVVQKTVNARPGTPVAISLSQLSSGTYTVAHFSGGVPAGEKVRFTRVR